MENNHIYETLIIGSGPCGVGCACKLKEAGIDFAVIESYIPGGKVNIAPRVDNYPHEFVAALKVSLNNREVKTTKTDTIVKVEGNSNDITPGKISVTYTAPDQSRKEENITKNREIFISPGSTVNISYPNGVIKTQNEANNKKPGRKDRRTFNPNNQIVVHCGNIGITITPKSTTRFEE